MNKIIRSLFLAIVVTVLVFPIGTVHPSTTTTITVNSTDDSISETDNVCTLREAIIAANTNQRSGLGAGECDAGSSFGSDTIIIPPGTYALTISGQDEDDGLQGDLDITTSITLQGAGKNETIVQGGATVSDRVDRVFHVNTLGSVHFEGLTIKYGNPSDYSSVGGGVLIENDGTVSVNNCKVIDNDLKIDLIGGGGGIANIGNSTLTITNSSFKFNQVQGIGATFGGGLYNASGTVNIANTTFYANSSDGSGGAFFNLGTAYISNVTMILNSSDYDSDESGDGGGIAGSGMTSLKNSLLENSDWSTINNFPDLSGNVLSADYNIIANLGDKQDFIPADHDIVGDSPNQVVPDLGDFQLASDSHQLHSTSLVIDQIPAESCTYQSGGSNPLFSDGDEITRDQRGAPRPNGSHCDIGARELFFLTVNSTEDTLEDDGECSLREAISTVNSGIPSGQMAGECAIPPDGIDLPAGIYTLAIEGDDEGFNQSGDLNIRTDLILSGAGADNTIIQAGPSPGSGIDRVLSVLQHRVTLDIRDLTIRHGQTDNSGGGIYTTENTLILIDVSISDNIAGYEGGGIYIGEFSKLIITGSSISSNQAIRSNGGGIHAENSSIVVANSTISNNQTGHSGGGIYGTGSLYLSNATVTSNTSDSDQDGVGDGGGILNYESWNIKNSIIANNIDLGGEKPDLADLNNEIPSMDYNLIGDIGTQAFAAAAHDIVGTSAFPEDPQLRDLTGTPAYQVPEAGSQVIDAIPAFNCTYTSHDSNPVFADGDAITNDQIGGTRPIDGDEDGHFACDIGAVEYIPPEHALVYLPLVMNE